MRLLTILLLTTISISASGQRLTGKYGAYYGHSLELKDDSTFRYEWKFDLITFWAVGQWSYSDKIVNLKFIDIYDTLKRPNSPDSLVLSIDEKSTQVKYEEFVTSQLVSGGQKHGGITNNLVFKRQRLYLADKEGRIMRGKQSGIMTKKKRPTWYFRTD
jgi:hypothetical protein